MKIKRLTLVYFSPTQTTQKVLESIARGMGIEDTRHIDLTLPQGAQQTVPPFSRELVLLGAPVYGGRLSAEAVKRFKKLKAEHTLAVPVVLYGNRDFEDALLELKDLAVELGFTPIAGGAFIGEHSFAIREVPIAKDRPDSQDVRKAMEFGANIAAKVAALTPAELPVELELPGRFPYKDAKAMTVSPLTDQEACTLCGDCALVCPTGAITVDKAVVTKTESCIRCCACIKSCPVEARYWQDEKMKTIIAWLGENCGDRKEPQVFGVDG